MSLAARRLTRASALRHFCRMQAQKKNLGAQKAVVTVQPTRRRLEYKSEYKKSFRPFSNYEYVGGRFVSVGHNHHAGMVTIKFQKESPYFNELLLSSLVPFLVHDFLDCPCRRRAF